MLVFLALTGVLAAAPDPPAAAEVAVLITSERRVAGDVAQNVLKRVTSALTAERVEHLTVSDLAERFAAAEGLGDPKRCQGATACVGQFAAVLGPRGVVVSVDVGKLGRNVTVQLDAVGSDGAVLASSALTVPANRLNATAGPLSAFSLALAQQLAARAEPPPVEPRPDAPRAVALEPLTPPPPPPAAVQLTTRPRSRLPWILGGAAVVAAVTSTIFGILALSDRGTWNRNLVPEGDRTGTALSATEAAALAGRINTESTVSLGVGIGAVGLGVAALITAFAP